MSLQLLLTIIAVSADSFFAGVSLSMGKKPNALFPFTVAVITFLLCLVANVIGNALKEHLPVDVISAVILAVIGICNIFRKEEKPTGNNLQTYVAVGFAVGIDAATASISIALTDNLPYLPVIMAVAHFLTVCAGTVVTKVLPKSSTVTNIVSGVILIVLALCKLT